VGVGRWINYNKGLNLCREGRDWSQPCNARRLGNLSQGGPSGLVTDTALLTKSYVGDFLDHTTALPLPVTNRDSCQHHLALLITWTPFAVTHQLYARSLNYSKPPGVSKCRGSASLRSGPILPAMRTQPLFNNLQKNVDISNLCLIPPVLGSGNCSLLIA
jgi:hypothetical protein